MTVWQPAVGNLTPAAHETSGRSVDGYGRHRVDAHVDALVLFMTPGLAFFYGGMVRAKNVLGMLMQNFFAMGLMAVLWALVGFTPGVR